MNGRQFKNNKKIYIYINKSVNKIKNNKQH